MSCRNMPQGHRVWVNVWLYSCLTSHLDGVGWLTPRPGCFALGRGHLTHLEGNGFFPGSVWMSMEKRKFLAPAGFQTAYTPALSKSLYPLAMTAKLIRTIYKKRSHQYIRCFTAGVHWGGGWLCAEWGGGGDGLDVFRYEEIYGSNSGSLINYPALKE